MANKPTEFSGIIKHIGGTAKETIAQYNFFLEYNNSIKDMLNNRISELEEDIEQSFHGTKEVFISELLPKIEELKRLLESIEK